MKKAAFWVLCIILLGLQYNILFYKEINGTESLHIVIITSWLSLLSGLGGYNLIKSYIEFRTEKKVRDIEDELSSKIKEEIDRLGNNIEAIRKQIEDAKKEWKSTIETSEKNKKSIREEIDYLAKLFTDENLTEALKQQIEDRLKAVLNDM